MEPGCCSSSCASGNGARLPLGPLYNSSVILKDLCLRDFVNLSFGGVFFTPSFDGVGEIIPPPSLFVKTIEKVIRLCLCCFFSSSF